MRLFCKPRIGVGKLLHRARRKVDAHEARRPRRPRLDADEKPRSRRAREALITTATIKQAARRRDGSPLTLYTAATDVRFPEAQNRKLISFYSFSASELNQGNLLCDAFGNTEIAVLVDRDLDGVIKAGSDFVGLPAVGGLTPGAADFPTAGVRAGVVFYALEPGATATSPRFVFSWK
jgi:hypothetical protein